MVIKTIQIVLALFITQISYAQYFDIRFFQPMSEEYWMKYYQISREETVSRLDARFVSPVQNRIFNKEGKLLIQDSDNEKIFCEYDELGNLIKKIDTLVGENGKTVVNNFSFSYNEVGFLSKAKFPNDYYSEFAFNNQKKIMYEVLKNEGENLEFASYYVFDPKNRLIKYKKYDLDRKVEVRGNVVYNFSGDILTIYEAAYPKLGGIDSSITQYNYSKKGELLQKKVTNKKYEIKNKENVVTDTYYEIFDYEYDEKGRKIKHVYQNTQISIFDFEQTWDYGKLNLPNKTVHSSKAHGVLEFELRYYNYKGIRIEDN